MAARSVLVRHYYPWTDRPYSIAPGRQLWRRLLEHPGRISPLISHIIHVNELLIGYSPIALCLLGCNTLNFKLDLYTEEKIFVPLSTRRFFLFILVYKRTCFVER